MIGSVPMTKGKTEVKDRTIRKFGEGCGGLFGGLAEVEADVEFLFEEVGAAGGVAEVFGGVAAGFDLEAYGAALEGGVDVVDALAMRVIESFGDAKDRGQAAGHALVEVGQGGISLVMAGGFGFAIVVAD